MLQILVQVQLQVGDITGVAPHTGLEDWVWEPRLGLRNKEDAGMVGSNVWTLKARMEQKPEEKEIMTTNKVTSRHFQENGYI